MDGTQGAGDGFAGRINGGLTDFANKVQRRDTSPATPFAKKTPLAGGNHSVPPRNGDSQGSTSAIDDKETMRPVEFMQRSLKIMN